MSDEEIQKQDETTEPDDLIFEEEGEAVSDTIKKLRERLKKCNTEKEEYLSGWQRSKADFVNARKEEEKHRAEFVKFAKKEILLEFVGIVDNFDMAFANKDTWEKVDQNWRIGVEYIHKEFLSLLERHGLKSFDAQGQMFDPARHASLGEVKTEKSEDEGKIAEVLQKGYELEGVVVRPAQVKVFSFEEKKS